MFFWTLFAFSMIQWMLAIWSLVPLPFLNPACTSESSWFTYCWAWSLAWRILNVTLLGCEIAQLYSSMNILKVASYFSSRFYKWASLVAQLVKNPPAMWETWVWFLGWEDPWRRERLPTPVFWPREFSGLYSPWRWKESHMMEWLSLSLFSTIRL